MRAVWHDDTEDTIVINQPTMKDNVLKYENNLSDGKYDVAVDVGASFASRREKPCQTCSRCCLLRLILSCKRSFRPRL